MLHVKHGHCGQGTEIMKGHSRPRIRPWIWLVLVGLIALVAHSTVLYYLLSHTFLSAAVASGVIGLIVIKHLGLFGPLYALLRKRLRTTK
jgi:drug/metabolite transporter (DMT)-like permease